MGFGPDELLGEGITTGFVRFEFRGRSIFCKEFVIFFPQTLAILFKNVIIVHKVFEFLDNSKKTTKKGGPCEEN